MKKFDLVIIGGGVGGLVAASGAAQLGARVALVEKKSLGGDCLNYGCVPTKRLVRSARVAHIARRAAEFGVECGPVKVDFPSVMEKMGTVQKEVGKRDSIQRFLDMGVEVFIGSGGFKDPHTFEVNAEALEGRRFLIATGSSPVILPIPGLRESGALTNESALGLKKLPESITILGAGPIGIEFAQVYSRFGAKVTVIEKFTQILPREDKELADSLHKMLEAEGIKIDVCTEVKEVKNSGGRKNIFAACATGDKVYDCEEVMIAIGRAPNVEGLGLEEAGVAYDNRRGITVDELMRTSRAHIYACGDVAGKFAFTHAAEYEAGIALSNALFPLVRRKAEYRAVPWVTFTDPELARVGATEDEARARYGDKNVRVYRFGFDELDRAVIDGEAAGMIKIVCDRKLRILGAHILGAHAGELIHEYVLAMNSGLPITDISKTMHVYPTLSQANKRAADQYYRERLFTGLFPKIARRIVRRGA